MKYITILIAVLFANFVEGNTNLTGVVQGSFLLIDKVYEEDGKLRPAIDWIESSSGQKRPKDTKQIFELINESTRVFLIRNQSETNNIMYVIATSPFPRISGGISSMEDNIFIHGNEVDLELKEVSESEYRKKLSNLFVYRITSSEGKKYYEPYNAKVATGLYENCARFYVLKDIYSFTMIHPEACSDNWYDLYNRYKTKIIFKEVTAGRL